MNASSLAAQREGHATGDHGSKKLMKFDKSTTLNRMEFMQVTGCRCHHHHRHLLLLHHHLHLTSSTTPILQCLVRLAARRYVFTGKQKDMSEALHQFFNWDLDARLHPATFQSSNAFRRRYCYTEATSSALEAHERSLRALYAIYAADGKENEGDRAASLSLETTKLMSHDEWTRFCRDMRLVDREFTPREATLCFVWSRMRVVDESCATSRRRLVHLGFEDFLEAIVRLCTMKALPTDDQIDEAGAEDAGEFILELQKDPKAWDNFLSENEQTWDVEPPQPIARCVDHLLTLLVRVVELNTAGAHVDGSASTSEVRKFWLSRREHGASSCTHAKISHEAQGLEVTHIDHDAVHHPGHITHHHEHHDHDDPHHGLGARRATHHHAHKEPSAAEPSAQMTRRHTMGLLREGTMKQQLPSSKGGRYG